MHYMVFLGPFLVAIGMIFIFVIYVCLLLYASRLQAAADAARARNAAMEDVTKPSKGLTPSELQGLPGAEDGRVVSGAECTVCLEDILDGQQARVLLCCGHAFHRRCVDEWLSTNAACPLCRTAVQITANAPAAAAAAAGDRAV